MRTFVMLSIAAVLAGPHLAHGLRGPSHSSGPRHVPLQVATDCETYGELVSGCRAILVDTSIGANCEAEVGLLVVENEAPLVSHGKCQCNGATPAQCVEKDKCESGRSWTASVNSPYTLWFGGTSYGQSYSTATCYVKGCNLISHDHLQIKNASGQVVCEFDVGAACTECHILSCEAGD